MRRRAAQVGVLALLVFCVQLALAAPAGAVPLTGGFSPTIIGQRADLNGDGVVNGRDDANAFYGDTSIIDGRLDCNAWTSPNDGTAGNGAIATNDDCELIGYDGTADGVTIVVSGGDFQVANGRLPDVFNAGDPDNPDVGDSDFAWSAIGGRVDSNGDETIDGDDCHFGLIGETVDPGLGDATDGADILGNPGANQCGFSQPPAGANNGFVDLNSDTVITALADSCSGCFFGLDLVAGLVQGPAPSAITLTPASATNQVDTNHIVTATVVDQFGDPFPGADVHFAVSGGGAPVPAAGDDVTDADGEATFNFTNSIPATNTITACVDADGGSDCDGGEVSDTATKTWVTDVVECPGFEGDPRNHVVGTAAGETLVGTPGRDIICGLGGNDILRGLGGNDLLLGGGGADMALGGAGADTARGGNGRDELRGGDGNDRLFGEAGNDSLFGQRGNDLLNGGSGRDSCSGGPGRDTLRNC